MAKYLFLYTGGSGGNDDVTDADDQEEMEQWMAWFASMGEDLVDMGSPLLVSKTVTADGVANTGASGVSGFSTVTAEDIEAAVEIARGCPIIATGGAVEVHEAYDMEM